jgi:hypothetical protein
MLVYYLYKQAEESFLSVGLRYLGGATITMIRLNCPREGRQDQEGLLENYYRFASTTLLVMVIIGYIVEARYQRNAVVFI